MSVIIRLQNLPWAANAADIRQYFQGLSIPEGGVHIVGGEKGDAFISFSTDEDARQAMLADGGCIKEVQIRLLLSSRNEMQKVIETARQQAMQLTQVYMQQMQQPQPQLSIIGSLQPPLTAKVLPQPQQQPLRPDRLQASLLHRNPPIIDPSAMLISQDKLQQQSENKDRDDKSHKRERTRSKSRDRRSKSSRSGGGGNSSRRDRSRSKDRRRRDRSRGRDRSRDRHRGSGGDRNSSSRSSGGKPHRSRSPSKTSVVDQQGRPWAGQYDGMQQQQQVDNNHPTGTTMNVSDSGPMFSQFRAPPQPPIIHPNAYQPPPQQQQQNPPNSEWGPTMQGEHHQQPQYVPNNNFRATVYDNGNGSDDEDDRQTEFDNNAPYRKFNDNTGPAMRRPPGQDFHNQQQVFSGRGVGPRFNKPQQSIPGGLYQRGGQRAYNDFGGGGGGPRFNNQQPRYKMADVGGDQSISDSGGRGGRQSRFSSVHEGGRPSRFNSMPVQHNNDASPEFDDSKRVPPRANDRYRYDVRNAQALNRFEGLCVEVNNMSNHFSYGDIRKLFEGIHIDGSAIKIQKHRQGVAFVRFDNNNNKNMAMQLSGTMYKGNHIEVKHLDDISYERENTDDRPYPSGPPAPTIVDHVDLVDDDDDNEPPPSSDDGDNSKMQQHNSTDDKSDDGNLVVCEKSGTKDTAVENSGDKKQSTEKKDPPTKFLKLQQLPITVTEEDVLNEIDGGGDVRRVTFYPDGEFKGAALEFQSVDTAEAALKRFDCVLLGSTPVPVLRCTYKEYAQIKRKCTGGGSGGKRFSNDGGRHHYHQQQHLPVNPPPSSMPQPPPPPTMPVPPTIRTNCVYLYGLPTTVTNTDITQFFSDLSILPDKIHIMLSKFGRPTGESYCEFGTAQQAHTALSKDQTYMGPSLVYVEAISRPDMIQAITKPMQHRNQQDLWGGGMRPPRHHNNMMQSAPRHLQGPPRGPSFGGNGPNGTFGGGSGGQYINNSGVGGRGGAGYTPRMRGPGPGPNTGPDGFGQPGCVVALDNVPYRADVQEIVDFFEGFDLNSQNVIRRFNDFGKPTGEARVNLRNPQEAMRALRILQNKPIFNRPVQLTLL